jgi:uncharacterized protein (DUF4415 family)
VPTTMATRAVLLDGKPYQRLANGTLKPMKGKTDWAAVDALTDEQLTATAEADPDARPMSDAEWADAIHLAKPPKVQLGMRLDADVLDWFKQRGTGYQTRIDAVLRRYIGARRKVG